MCEDKATFKLYVNGIWQKIVKVDNALHTPLELFSPITIFEKLNVFVRRVGGKCLSRFTKHSCRISQNIQTNRKRGETMSRFWSNVHSLFPELDWKWVQWWVQEQGREDFFCVIHTPSAKSRNLNPTLSGLNTFPERCYEVKNGKMIFPLLSWSEGDRERQKRREGYFPLTASPPLFVLRGLFTILHD